MKEMSVVITGEDREVAHTLEELKKVKIVQTHVEFVALANLREALYRIHPQLVIYEMDGNVESVRDSTVWASRSFSNIPWAVVSESASLDLALEFIRLGAIDFLKAPLNPEDLKHLLERVIDLENRRSTNGKDENQNQIAIFSTKGGVGQTTVAVNLAAELARQQAGKILLLDLVLQHGNVGDFLDLPSKYTLIDVVENFERLDSNLLENSLAKHELGFFVLPCPKEPEKGDFITTKEVADVFRYLKSNFNYVIADVGHEFSQIALAYLDVSDLLLLVTTPDVPSLLNTRTAFDTFKRLGYPAQKMKVVLNRWRMKGEIDSSLIPRKLGLDLAFRLMDDPVNCLNAVNLGKPLLSVAKNSELTKAFRDLVSILVEPSMKKEKTHVTQ